MKHAGDATLDEIAGLLEGLRKHQALKEKKRGVFYLKSAAFLHFHEDPEGIFADVRADTGWERLPVNTKAQRRAFLARVRDILDQ
jgi:hypothetical protein